MPAKKSKFDASVLMAYADALDEAGGTDAIIRATNAAMLAAKTEINNGIRSAMAPGNLPAGGAYSTGKTLDSLDTSMVVEWEGNIASIALGFDMDKSGIVSMLLMTGTPKMRPAKGLREAVYGESTRRKVRQEMEIAVQKVLERLGG